LQPRRIKIEFPTDNDAKNSCIFIVGQTGSGKTVLLFNLAQAIHRVVVYDIMHEMDKLGDARDHAVFCTTIAEFVRLLEDGYPKIVFRPADEFTHEDQLNAVVAILEDFQEQNPRLGDVTFCCDELSKITTPQKWPIGLSNLCQRGRHFRIEKILAFHFLSRFPAPLRDCASEWYVFRQVDYRAFETLRVMGWPEDIIEQVSELPDLHCIHFDGHNFERIILEPNTRQNNGATSPRIAEFALQ